ncbi:hypothetical protein [Mucilaginibacter xinganensis]|uniref:Uncharacterized protein n=1 Tax=Mucilaginibacter xinganensis TaxID=1234841 RepID=A0A223NV08_9SPHI|nr:hypothetical protein [Mucilaginibacter xinganensis]ASU33712.1 hypothetical protein MuYL_1816 [Mucilaginibacter xinganensis]
MKKNILTFLAVVVLMAAFSGNSFSQQKAKAEKDEDDEISGGFYSNHTPGTWDAVIKGDQVNIPFYGAHWSFGRNFPVTELGTLPVGKTGTFTLTREAGKMTFRGVFESGFGHGSYIFEENTTFKNDLAARGYKGLDKQLMIDIFFTDINRGYFDYMKANGYAEITNSQLKDLAEQNLNHKVLADYFELFKTEGYGHQPIDKIVELREHGVNAGFVNSVHQIGFKKIPLDQALELRDHGVNAEFIGEFKKMGYGSISLEKAQDLRDHGVSVKYISSLQNMGYKNVTLDRAQDLRDHGVSPEFINSIQNMGYKNITLEKAQELKDHGVSPEFIKGVQSQGFKELSLDQAQELKDHGVTVAYIQKTKAKGLSNIRTLDDYIKLKETGF